MNAIVDLRQGDRCADWPLSPHALHTDQIQAHTQDPDRAAEGFAAHLAGEILGYNQSDGRSRTDVQRVIRAFAGAISGLR